MIFQDYNIVDVFIKIMISIEKNYNRIKEIINKDSDIHELLIEEAYPEITKLKNSEIKKQLNLLMQDKNNEEIMLAVLYIKYKAEIDKLSFNKLSKIIKERKGEIPEYILERTILTCYHDFSEVIIKSAAKKKGIIFIDSDDIESIKTVLYFALKEFDKFIPPHDINAYIAKIVENKLNTMIKNRVRKKYLDESMLKENSYRMETEVEEEENIVKAMEENKILEIVTGEEQRILIDLLKQYNDSEGRKKEVWKTILAITKLKYECRAIFIKIIKYSIQEIEYTTKKLILDLGLEKSEDAMRQSIRMCRKRLASIMGKHS